MNRPVASATLIQSNKVKDKITVLNVGEALFHGAKTVSIITLIIMTFSFMGLIVTLRISQ